MKQMGDKDFNPNHNFLLLKIGSQKKKMSVLVILENENINVLYHVLYLNCGGARLWKMHVFSFNRRRQTVPPTMVVPTPAPTAPLHPPQSLTLLAALLYFTNF